ncbi:hypothetical protein J3E73DRAFT_389528 [Bipolaris maydis]|nr:hypothetical protein J3E73DRAFT_389528 [Bipolaris maydis]
MLSASQSFTQPRVQALIVGGTAQQSHQQQPQQYPTPSVQTQEGITETQHQRYCVQAALGIYNLYYHGQAQLQSIYRNLQISQNKVGNIQRQIAIAEQELQRERDSNKLLNQGFIELQECHSKLLDDHKSCKGLNIDLHQSTEKSKEFANKVSQRAEGLVNSYRAKLARNKVGELQNSQTISGMILESAKNALLIKAISSQHPEDEHFAKLKYIIDQNVDFQQRNLELSKINETLSQQVRNNKDKIASLNKALKLTVKDRQRRKPRRGKICYGGQTIAIEMEPQCMQKSKQSRNAVQYIDFLNRRNGELRLELTFYRECYRHTEKFKQKITNISQDLLHAYIVSLLDEMAFGEILGLSQAFVDAVDQLRDDQGEAFNAFVAPYKALNSSKNTTVSKDGWI